MKTLFRNLLTVALLLGALDGRAALIAQYEMNGPLRGAPGVAALPGHGGGLDAGPYIFDANQGLAQDPGFYTSHGTYQPYPHDGHVVNSAGHASFATNFAHFLRDDRQGSEAAAGAVDYIHVYDSAFSAAEVKMLQRPAIPLAGPGALGVMGLGLVAVGFFGRRRLV